MLSDASPSTPSAAGLPALRRALLSAFARPGGSTDLALRDLAVLLTAAQRPGQDIATLVETTGLGPDSVRRAVESLRRGGLLANKPRPAGEGLALVATASGEKVVRDMARGMGAAAPTARGLAPRMLAEGMGFEPT